MANGKVQLRVTWQFWRLLHSSDPALFIAPFTTDWSLFAFLGSCTIYLRGGPFTIDQSPFTLLFPWVTLSPS
jgi:hypothetical protein